MLHAKRANLVAIVDVDEKVVKHIARMYGISHYYLNIEELLDSDTVDAIYISTPNHLHSQYTIQAAEAGKHVLCEKPMATTAEECKRMIESIQRNKVKFMIAYMSRFNEANIEAKRLIAEGIIGKPIFIKSQFAFVKTSGDDDWRLDPKRAGGGCLLDVGVYPIDAIEFIVKDQIVEVMAWKGNIRSNWEVEDIIIASFRLSQGAMGTFVCGYSINMPSTFEIYGTEGNIIVIKPFGQYATSELELIRKNKRVKKELGLSDPNFACYQKEIEYFCECVEEDREPEANGEIGLYAARVVDAIYQSAITGRRIIVDPKAYL